MSTAYFKACPEDFVVDEIPLYPAQGSGPHTFVRVEKRMRTTEEVAGDLARAAGVSRREVGYAGRKDLVSIARQWFSIPDLDPELASAFEIPGVRVLEAIRHQNKLRTGHLQANRFAIWVRGLTPELIVTAQDQIDALVAHGFANRFGAQRFGRAGENAKRGLEILLGAARPRDRRRSRFFISALQAQVFNRVLDTRPLSLDRFEVGDIAVKHESGGLFCVEDVAVDNERARNFEISATGPIFGKKVARPLGVPAEREKQILEECGVPDHENLSPPRGVSLRGARRSLRARATDFEHRVEGDAMKLEFTLPSGSYATVLLEQLYGPLRDGLPENLGSGPGESA
ncbi:MAG: tRNA pseudouridine(13) synthase TruD [Deltaproteobacteria bacterium]|nr:tRNA pseudouridine(13) synthase TruD [Deltaproteobacteria bacterium]